MSHVASYETVPGKPFIVDLEAVKMAAQNLGLEVHDRRTYKWYGSHMGDYKLPYGWKKGDMGNNATLVLSVSPEKKKELGIGDNCYELAVVTDHRNPGCYTLQYDFFDGGKGLDRVIGTPLDERPDTASIAPLFVQQYRMCADALAAKQSGDAIRFKKLEDGSWESVVTVNAARIRN